MRPFLFLVLIAGFMMAACQKTEAPTASNVAPSVVSASEAYKMIQQNTLLVDVRETSEVAAQAYNVANVVNIPMSEFQGRMSEIPKDKPVILACLSGARSAQALSMLQAQGFAQAMNLEGGMMAWQAQGLPVK